MANELIIKNGLIVDSGGVQVTGSTTSTQGFIKPGAGSQYLLADGTTTNGTVAPPFPYTGSAIISGSLTITGSLDVTQGITGSLLGTSSYATNALTASYVLQAVSSSFSTNSISASYALSSSFSTTSSFAISSSNALTASYILPLNQNVLISGSLKLDPTQDPDPTGLDLDSTTLFQSSSNTALGYDLYVRQNGNLVKWKWIEGILETGLLYGGAVTYSGSNVYVSPGSGIIADHNATTSSEVSPMIEYVTWNAITQSVANIATQQVTYLYIDNNGSLQQQSTRFTSQQYHDYIPLGAVGHFDYTQVSAFGGAVQTAYDQGSQTSNFIDAFGPLKVSGYGLTGQANSLRLSVGSGTSFIHGGFYQNDPEFPSQITTPSQATASLVYVYRSGSGVLFDTNGGNLYTSLRPEFYDVGNGTTGSISNNNWTIQHIYSDPKTGVLYVYYGQTIYTTYLNAVGAVATDEFTEGYTFDFTTFIGFAVVKSNTLDIVDTVDNKLVPAGLFRGSGQGSGGGTAVSNLEDLTDVSITSPTNGQALIYNAGIWQNGNPISASYALTSSYVKNAQTASYITPLNQNVIITGSLTVGSPPISSSTITFTNPGIGGDTRFTFSKTNDSAWLSVVERSSDRTYYEFGMSDNPDQTDYFQWKMDNYQAPAHGWMPLQIGEFTNRFVASSNLMWGNFSIPINTAFSTVNNSPTTSSDYQVLKYAPTNSATQTLYKDSGTGTGTVTLNAQSYTGASRQSYWIVIDAGGTTFTWGNGPTFSTPVATGVVITGAAQTLSNGVTVTLSLTGHLANDRWSFLCFARPTSAIGGSPVSSTMQTIYPVSNSIGQVIKGASGQTSNLQEWQNSSGTALAKVDALGSITAPSFTGSLFGTASYITGSIFTGANPALTASYALTSSLATTASYVQNAQTSSYILQAVSSSYALTASYAMNAGGATIDTGSLLTTASFNSYTSSNTSQFAGTSSYALTASYIPTLQQVTTAGTSSTNPITVTVGEEYYPTNGISSYSQGGVGVRGESGENYGVYGIANSVGVYGEGGNTGVAAYSATGVGLEVYGGSTSINVTGYIGRGLVLTSYGVPVGNSIEIIDADTVNLTVNQQGELTATKVTSPSFTGSLFGTASWAVSSSRASSSSYALTASFALNAGGATVNTGSLVTTASFNSYTGSTTSQFAGTASFAQSSSNFEITNTLRLDNTLTYYKTSTSTTSETLNLFQQATGSYTSAFVKYSILNGTNARAGEFVTVWNGTTVVNYDNSTTDIGNTAAVTFNSSIVSSQIQINAVVSAGWTVKALATFI